MVSAAPALNHDQRAAATAKIEHRAAQRVGVRERRAR